MSILYISYDGMLEPLGQSQVLGYLKRLAVRRAIHLVSFEKPSDWTNVDERMRLAAEIALAGIVWHPLRYHKRPSALATSWDISLGISMCLWLVIRYRLKVVHARSYVPSVMALVVKRITGVRYLFDMRGFWADERVDGGIWRRNSRLYRIAKSMEHRFLRAADLIVTLTNASASELKRFPALVVNGKPITVIPTCADLSMFQPSPALPSGEFVLGYVGSVGTWYLFEETLAFFKALLQRRPDARFLVVNRKEHDSIRMIALRAGVPLQRIELVSARHDEVAPLVQRMHLGAMLIRPSFSKIASAPTKMAEYLGCGVPCLGNSGVGDVAEILERRKVGIVLDAFNAASIDAAVDHALTLAQDTAARARCVEVARDLFSLESGVAAYERVYEALIPAAPIPPH
jgi:glycosyltransferase involved in cell wall biosynthesis